MQKRGAFDGCTIKKRVEKLVKENMKITSNAIKGISTSLKESNMDMASIQAAWRFYNNERVDIHELFETLKAENREIAKNIQSPFILVAHDWSWLDYKNHNAKEDLIVRDKKGNSKQIGWDLQASLLVDPNEGRLLAPMAINLKTSKEIYSSYSKELNVNLTHLQELSKRCAYIDSEIETKEVVHIIDREADSVLFMRELQKCDALFLIRVKKNAKVYWNEKECEIKQKELAKELSYGKEVARVKYHKKEAKLFVNECDITITRDYTTMSVDESGKRKLIKIPGEALKARFVVSRVVDFQGKLLSTWMLVTNVEKERADSATLATWYYYRWSIESYFKLLKTAGFNLERWQQEKPVALFRRLIVVAYAVVLVFKLANSDDENAQEIRRFLVKLSGRLMEYGVEYTLPALLSGLWIFLRMMDLLQILSVDELYALKEEAQKIMGFRLFEV